jgi:hypothetical protein
MKSDVLAASKLQEYFEGVAMKVVDNLQVSFLTLLSYLIGYN